MDNKNVENLKSLEFNVVGVDELISSKLEDYREFVKYIGNVINNKIISSAMCGCNFTTLNIGNAIPEVVSYITDRLSKLGYDVESEIVKPVFQPEETKLMISWSKHIPAERQI